MIISVANAEENVWEVEVKSGHSVYAEANAELESDTTKAVYTQWGDLEENLRLEIEELSREISEIADRLKDMILLG